MIYKVASLPVSKLVKIVLLIVVLVLVLYGVAYGGLNPLTKQLGEKMDNVLVMLHLKDNFQDCYSENVRNLGDGDSFLNEVGAGKKGAIFSVCRDAMCNISVDGVGDYKKADGKFYKYIGGKWLDGSIIVIPSNLKDIKFYYDLYNVGAKMIDKSPVRKIYDNGFTKQFILYGEGNKIGPFVVDKPTWAIWQNGVWKVSVDGGKFYTFTDDDKAIKKFIAGVDDRLSDVIYLKEVLVKPGENSPLSLNEHGKRILLTRLVNIGWNNNNLDSANLEKIFFTEKKKLIAAAIPSKDDINKIKKVADGKVVIDGRSFVVAVESGKEFPIITFTSGNDKYGLKHVGQLSDLSYYYGYFPDGKIGRAKLKNYPISIVKWENGKWIDNNIEIFSGLYRLPDSDFRDAYDSTLIKKFLDNRCR